MNKKIILAVEDIESYQDILQDILEPDFKLKIVDSLDKAEQLIKLGRFDLLITKIDIRPKFADISYYNRNQGGFFLLRILGDNHPLIPSIIWTITPNIEAFSAHKSKKKEVNANRILTYQSIYRVFDRRGNNIPEEEYFKAEVNNAIQKYEKAISKKKNVDFIIFTALSEEFEAVKKVFSKKIEKLQPWLYYVKLSLGNNKSYNVIIAQQTRMGQGSAAALATLLCTEYNPKRVLLVGIAGGKKGTVNLGDIIVADKIIDSSEGEVISGKREIRWRTCEPDMNLLNASKSFAMNNDRSKFSVTVHHAPIFSGNDVVKDNELTNKYSKIWKKGVGVEMEGAGAATAIVDYINPIPKFLMIRGVSDFAGENKEAENKEARQDACEMAAKYTYVFLKSEPV